MSGRPSISQTLEVRELSVAIAHIASRDPVSLGARVGRTFGLALPQGPNLTQSGPLRLLGISPGRWWAVRDPADYDFAADVASMLRPEATVCDLSDAYVVLRLQGSAVAATLARLIAIDLHPRAFAVGQVAATVAEHIPVTFWRLPDAEGVVYDLAVPRSYAETWQEVLRETAATSGAGASVSR